MARVQQRHLASIQELIESLDGGEFAQAAAEALKELLDKIRQENGKGTLTMKFVVKPLSMEEPYMDIHAELAVSAPKHVSRPSRFQDFSDDLMLDLFQTVEAEGMHPENVELLKGGIDDNK